MPEYLVGIHAFFRKRSGDFGKTIRLSTVVMLSLLAVVHPRASYAQTLDQYLRQLSSVDEGERFDAAVALVSSPDGDLPERLTRGAKDAQFGPVFAESAAAKAALDFVVARRSPAGIQAGPVPGPHVILVSIDTLRADHLGCYGYDRPTTPTLDTVGAQGAVFLNALSPSSWTLPAHMSLFTSLYPSAHKLEMGGKLGSVRLDDSERTLAESLKAAGYATAGLVAHPFLSREWGFDHGFDLYRRYLTEAEMQITRAALWLEWHAFHVQRRLHQPRFLLFVHVLDPHDPYSAPAAYIEKFFPDYHGPLKPSDSMVAKFLTAEFPTLDDFRYAVALYDAEINYVDTQLQRLLAGLERLGWRDTTILVVTSDHGEEFKEHGSMGHKGTLYDEQLKVPLLISYPGQIATGQRITTAVSLLDVLPTVLDLLGLSPPAKIQGASLARQLRTVGDPAAATATARRPHFAELGPMDAAWERPFQRRAARIDGLKLIVTFQPPGRAIKQLYDLDADPREQHDLYAARHHDPAVQELEHGLEAFIRTGLAHKPGAERNRIDIDAETRERLRALGYME